MIKFYPILNEAGKEEYNSENKVNRVKLGDLDEVKAPDGSIVNLRRIKNQIKQIKTLIVVQDPLYAPFVYDLTDVYTWSVKTMGTDGNWLFINPKWTEKLNFDECTFVIYHELMHCLLDHMKRGKAGNYNALKYNYAADYEINAMFVDENAKDNPAYSAKNLFGGALSGVLYDIKFLNWPAEAIYDVIPQPDPEDGDGDGDGESDGDDNGEGKEGGGDGKSGKPSGKSGKGDSTTGKFEAGEMGEANSTDARLQREFQKEAGNQPGGLMSPELGKKIAEAAGLSPEEIAKQGNKTAADWEEKSRELLERAIAQNKSSGGGEGNMLTKILGDHHNSVVDWRKVLSQYVGDILSKKDTYWTMPNRRYSAQDPDSIRIRGRRKGKQLSKIVVCMDTSGSMERQLIQSIVDEINGILYLRKVKEIVVLFFDTKIHEPQIIAGNESAYCPAVIGGGGTNFQVPLDYINEEFDDNISLCLFFTDGYEAIPLEPSYGDKFIWIVYDNPNWPNSQHVGNNPLFGKKILVNSKSLKASTQSPTNESVAFFGRLVTENIKNYLR